jgi:SAM-dependent methyltransferase
LSEQTQANQIIGSALGLASSLDPWLSPSSGRGVGLHARAWMKLRFDQATQDIFGFQALQLGASSLNTLALSRIPHRWVAADNLLDARATFYANASALPFFESTLDLVTLALTLDLHSDPESVLDEVARVLVPEGRVLIAGINPFSLWGLCRSKLPASIQPYGYKPLLAALADLGLQAEAICFGAYTPPLDSGSANPHVGWLDSLAARWLPRTGGLYFIVAKKRILGLRPKRRIRWRLPKLADLPLNPFPSPSSNHVGGIRKDE